MKKIETGETKWQQNIFRDLDYIKKNLRYPWKRSMKAPVIITAGFIIFSVISGIAFLFAINAPDFKMNNIFIHYFWLLCSLFLAVFSIFRYLGSLRFIEIKTGLSKALNQQLICSFLQKKHLVIYRHPECPDIIQILSRPLNVNAESEQREALVFIADEGRTLVNSHFTGTRWFIMLKKRYDNIMAKELHNYINLYKEQQETRLKSKYD